MKTLVCCILLFALFACQPSSVQEEGTAMADKGEPSFSILQGTDTAILNQQTLFRSENDTLDYERKDIAKIVFVFPQIDSFRSSAVKDSVNLLIHKILLQNENGDLAYSSIDQRLEEFIADFIDFEQEMRDFGLTGYAPKWSSEVHIDAVLNAPDILTLRVYEHEFTGGAHAHSALRFISVNMNTGQQLKLKDVFLSPDDPYLLSMAEAKFKTRMNWPVDTNLLETDLEFEGNGFSLPDNFSVQQKTIGFHYNPYDLGAYSLGTIAFEIPYDDIHQLINPTFVPLDTSYITNNSENG